MKEEIESQIKLIKSFMKTELESPVFNIGSMEAYLLCLGLMLDLKKEVNSEVYTKWKQ